MYADYPEFLHNIVATNLFFIDHLCIYYNKRNPVGHQKSTTIKTHKKRKNMYLI